MDIMGGLDSPGYAYFKKLFKEGFEAARKHSDSLLSEFPKALILHDANNSHRGAYAEGLVIADDCTWGVRLMVRLEAGLLPAVRPANDTALPRSLRFGSDNASGGRVPGASNRQLDGQQLHETL